jgi:signal transduction histidine kinase
LTSTVQSWLDRLGLPTVWPSRRAAAKGILLWCALSAVVLVGWWLPGGPRDGGVSWWALAGCLLLLAMALVVSRTHPLAALAGTAALSLVTGWFSAALGVVAYLHGRQAGRMRSALLVLGAAAVAGTLLVVASGATVRTWLGMLSVLVFGGVLPWLVGSYRRQRFELIRAGWLRAEMLEREQEATAEQVRLRERARIAQEMHDSLGHEISLIALRAGALELAPDLDPRYRAAAEQVRRSAGEATERLREIIGVLRVDGDSVPMQPARDAVTDLVERVRASGMAVTLDCQGDLERLPDLVHRAAYSVVREALTNAARHAPGASVTVRLIRPGTDTVVTVVNAAPARQPPADRPRGGHGLISMRERVRLVGGSLHAGPGEGGGFEVTARLPHAAAPADRPTADERRPVPAERTESSWRLDRETRRLRRRLVAVILVPFVALVAILVGYYSYVSFNAVLNSSDFDRLRVGQSRAEIEPLLPPRQVPGRPDTEPPKPLNSSCEYYSDGSFLVRSHVYRLCFAGGRLVAKDDLSLAD